MQSRAERPHSPGFLMTEETLLALEPRILLDGAALVTLADQVDGTPPDPVADQNCTPDPQADDSGHLLDALQSDTFASTPIQDQTGPVLLFVDAELAEVPAIQQAIAIQQANNSEFRVLRLEAGDSQLIRDTLAAYDGAGVPIERAYILSRDAEGQLDLSPVAAPQPATPLFDLANGTSDHAALLDAATGLVNENLTQWAASETFLAEAAIPFSADANNPLWSANAQALRQSILSGDYGIRLEVLSDGQLQGALGAYSPTGTAGQPTIYLNGDWLATASPEAVQAVLLEELGHDFDNRLNGSLDSPGDEGHAFAGQILYGDANLNANLQDDHQVLDLDGQAVSVEAAGPYNVAQVTFVPLPEPDVQTSLKGIAGGAVSGTIETIIAITATSNNTIIVYDHWEDGYEADIKNPIQSSTQIWGDGNTANGTAPGTTDDLIGLGQTITLRNSVNPVSPSTVDYDGRDKIGSTKAIAVTKAGWSQNPGTLLAGAVNLIDTGNLGRSYTIPIGQTTATPGSETFQYTSVHVMATEDNTTVSIDKEGNGSFETTVTLSQGQNYLINGGVLAGAKINADKAIAVNVIAGDIGATYENRWLTVTPTEQWASSYYAPVGTTEPARPAYVFLYNPSTQAITVTYDTQAASGQTVVVAANTAIYVEMPLNSAAHFYTTDNAKFSAVGTIDPDTTQDWSYSLVPESYLTDKFVVAWGPGNGNTTPSTSGNGSPVWVTATAATTLQIDTNGDGTVDRTYAIKALESYRIFDNSDNDQTGLTVWTTDGTLLTAAWGEDPSVAGAGSPYLDMGYTVTPYPDYVLRKDSQEANPSTYGTGVSDGDGLVELGEQLEYNITVKNLALFDLNNINIQDALTHTENATYVANSATLTIYNPDGTVLSTINDLDGSANSFPLTNPGYTITDVDPNTAGIQGLERGAQAVITYRMTVRSDINQTLIDDNYSISNTVSMNGDSGVGDPVAKTSTDNTRLTVPPSVLITDNNGAATGAESVAENGSLSGKSFTIAAPDGLNKITVAGTNVTAAQLAASGTTNVNITTPQGILTLKGYNATTGAVSYSYDPAGTQKNHSSGEVVDNIGIVVTDTGGDTGSGTLGILITDTAPVANADRNSITEDAASVSGNAIAGGASTDVADSLGTDSPANVTGVAAGTQATASGSVGAAVTGTYGRLTLSSNGGYSYALDNTNGAVQNLNAGQTLTDTFTYTITDADGDASTAQVIISINGVTDPPALVITDRNGGSTGDNSIAENATSPVTGSFTLTTPNGLQSVTVGGSLISEALLLSSSTTPVNISTAQGTLSINGFNASTGVVSYSYQQSGTSKDHAGGDTSVVDSVAILVTDDAGTSTAPDNLDILITDTAPVANADRNSITEDAASVSGNAIASGAGTDVADSLGTDSPANVTGVTAGTQATASGNVGTAVTGTYGRLTLSSNGGYSYALDNGNGAVQNLNAGQTLTDTFTYTITDADGDASSSQITLTIQGANDPPTISWDRNNSSGGADDGGFATSFTEGSSPVTLADTDADVLDLDDTAMASLTLTAGGIRDGASEIFTLGGSAFPQNADKTASVTVGSTSFAISYTQATGTFAISKSGGGEMPVADINSLLRGISYQNSSDNPTAGNRTLSATTNDGAASSNTAVASISVVPVNDAPVAVNNSYTAVEDVLLTGKNIIGDDDNGATAGGLDYDLDSSGLTIAEVNGTLWASLTGGAEADHLAANGWKQVTLSHGTLYIKADGTTHYQTAPNDTAGDSFTYKVGDGSTSSNTATVNISVTPVNDPPASSDDAVTTAEDTAKVLAITDFGTYSDTEGSAIAAVKITTLESNGSLEFHNGSAWVAVTLNQEISKADIDAGKLRFVPDADENGTGYATIGFKVSDGTDFSSSASTLRVHVTPVNDTPTLSQATGNAGNANDQVFEEALASGSNPASTAEAVAGTLTLGDLDGLDDIRSLTFDQTGGIGATLTIGTGAGEFTTLGAMAGQSFTTANGRVTLTGYNAGVFSYGFELTSPSTDTSGTEQNSFRATLSDGTATASATVTIDILDDVPTAVADARSLTEGTASSPAANLTGNLFASGGTGDVADRQGADVRANPVIKVIAGNTTPATDVSAGTTSANGTLVTGNYGSLTLGADGSYSYDLDDNNATVNALKAGDSLTEVFSYRITDADGDTSDTTLTITLNGTSDGSPAIVPVDSNGAANGEASVYEAGLASGTDSSETTTGSVTINALDGLSKINLGGTEVTAAQLASLGTTPVIIDTGEGTLTLSGYSSTSEVGGVTTGGTLSYSYTLKANLDHGNSGESSDPIALTITDRGNSTASGTLTLRILDDVPTAVADARSLTEGTAASPAANLTGNLFASGATGDVADRQGADVRANPVIKVIAGNTTPATDVSAGTTSANGTLVTGNYGSLRLGADGSYSYDLDDNNATVNALKTGDSLTEVFSYRITDADGDTSDTTLTITLNGNSDGSPAIVPVDGNGAANGEASVYEAGLASGTDSSETTTGSVTINALDGLSKINLGGTEVTAAQLASLGTTPVIIDTGEGTLTLSGYSSTSEVGGVTTGGTLSYSYTLKAPLDHSGATESSDPVALTITDRGNGTATGTLTIQIVDDVPTAVADARSLTEGTASSPAANQTGNLFASGATGDVADRQGADARANPVIKVIAGNTTPATDVSAGTTSANGTLVTGSYGSLRLGADGSYSYDLDDNNATVNALKAGDSLTEVFSYRITDADGDTSDTTLTITLNGTSDSAPAITPVDGNGAVTGEASVYEAGLTSGADSSETATGSVTISALDSLSKINVGGTEVTAAQLGNLSTTPVIIDTGEGTLTLTGYSSTSEVGGITTSGTLSYSYTLKASLDHSGATESSDPIALTITDRGNGTASGTLTLRILDDVPSTVADVRSLTEGTASSPAANLTGNVFASGASGDQADRQGADVRANPVIKVIAGNATPATDVSAGTTSANGTLVTGSYGSLTLGADGSYSYDLDDNNATVNALKAGDSLTEVFSYRITDADGDTSDTTLTITINGTSDGSPAIVPVDGNGAANGEASVYEAGLASGADSSETATGSVTISALDSLSKINVGGTEVTAAQLGNLSTTPVIIDTGEGTLTLTGYSSTSEVGGITTSGTLSYSYTLKAPLDHSGATESSDPVALTIIDRGNGTASATLTLRILDDVPTANADARSLTEGTASSPAANLTGNLFASGATGDVADRQGADVRANPVIKVIAGNTTPATDVSAGTTSANGTLVTGSYGSLRLGADGSYSYDLDDNNATVNALKTGDSLTEVFSYRITDADGDTSDTTLTITLNGTSDSAPAITPVDGNGAVTGEASVYEAGLTSGADSSETATGSVTISALDSLSKINVGGTEVTAAQLGNLSTTPVIIDTGEGTLTLTGYSSTSEVGGITTSGTLSYSYTLKASLDHSGATESSDPIALTITDRGNGTASGTLTLRILDDVPVAIADVDRAGEDQTTAATGNVITGTDIASGNDSNSSDGAADTLSADQVNRITGVQAGTTTTALGSGAGSTINGSYGKLSLDVGGSYSYLLYTRAENASAYDSVQALDSGETLTDTFSYTLADGDGDSSNTTLTFTIDGANDTPTLSQATGNAGNANDQVFEEALASGSNPAATAEAVAGTLTLGDLDGLDDIRSLTFDQTGGIGATLTIGTGAGEFTTLGAMAGQSFTTANGRVTLTGYNAGVFSYGFELTSPTIDASGAEQNSFRATLSDGTATASATVTIDILDDAPTAVADSDAVSEDGSLVATGNVMTGIDIAGGNDANASDGTADIPGADRPLTLTGVVAGIQTSASGNVGNSVTGSYGRLTLNADGGYSYVLDNGSVAVQSLAAGERVTDTFTYSITDADGDTSTTQLVITIDGANDAPLAVDNSNAITEDAVPNSATGNVLTGNQGGVDRDPDASDTLTVGAIRTGAESGSGTAGTLGSPLAGTYGSLTQNADGTYSYALNNGDPRVQALDVGQTLADTFTYTISDGNGGTDNAQLIISIQGANDPVVQDPGPPAKPVFDPVSDYEPEEFTSQWDGPHEPQYLRTDQFGSGSDLPSNQYVHHSVNDQITAIFRQYGNGEPSEVIRYNGVESLLAVARELNVEEDRFNFLIALNEPVPGQEGLQFDTLVQIRDELRRRFEEAAFLKGLALPELEAPAAGGNEPPPEGSTPGNGWNDRIDDEQRIFLKRMSQ